MGKDMNYSIGDSVKIRRRFEPVEGDICGERFWVRVSGEDGEIYTGVVDNLLLYADQHGLNCGDKVSFAEDEILDAIRVH